MDEQRAVAAFAALSNATRLRILRCLVKAGEGGMNAGGIAEAVEATPSRASFHLSTMAQAGLVIATRQARMITYRVDFDAMGGLLVYLLEDCCAGDETLRSCCAGRSVGR